MFFFWISSRLWGKAVEDYRSPRRFATGEAAGKSARSWTARVLWRFSRALGIGNEGNSVSTSSRPWGKAVEDYRSPRRFATGEASRKRASDWTAPVFWCFGCAPEIEDAVNSFWISSRL